MLMGKIMWPKLLIGFLLCNISFASSEKTFLFNKERNKFHLSTSVQGHSTNITSSSSATSVESSSDFSIISQLVSGEYFINESFSVGVSYYFALVLDIDAEIQGLDIGLHYYPLKNGTSKKISIMGSQIESSPEWAPYVYIGASTRDYQFSTVSLKFQGTELQGGTYWHWRDDYFFKANVFVQQHLNNNVRTLSTLGAALGIGVKF